MIGEDKHGKVLGKTNFMIMLGGIALIALGFLLMAGGGTELGPDGVATEFNADALYSPRRITVAPILIVLGLAAQVVAIWYKPKQTDTE